MKRYNTIKHFLRALAIAIFVLSPVRVCADFTPILPGTGNDNDIGGDSTGAWTPTNAGLVIQLNPGDQFRLSTVINGVEYFVCDYSEYDGGKFKYSNDPTGDYLKLIPRNNDGTPPGDAISLWTVGDPLARKTGSTNYSLVKGIDGILYTMWRCCGKCCRQAG